jgi:threonine synthase
MGPGRWWRVCRRCGRIADLSTTDWTCPCGGLVDLTGPPADPVADLDQPDGPWSLWRYRRVLPWVGDACSWERVTLGEGLTPLVPVRPGLWCKLDYVTPTGSFKDRGAAVMLSLAAGLGVRTAVVDSSGNAGKAVAAYSARAGVTTTVFVPGGTSPAAGQAVESYGARLVEVAGGRAAAADAARDAAESGGAWYASHVYRPEFAHGVKTLAFELWEQLGGRAPGAVVVPAGNGTLVLGAWIGFRELLAAGRIARLPRIFAVQAENCAPLAGLRPTGSTLAKGIAIAQPPRAGEVRAAIVASGGQVLTVTELDLDRARRSLAEMGMGVEPTSASVWAAWGMGKGPAAGVGSAGASVVLVLTGAA